MAKFKYEALNQKGEEISDTIEADTKDEAVSRIRNLGYFPTKIREAEAPDAQENVEYQGESEGESKEALAKALKNLLGGEQKEEASKLVLKDIVQLMDVGIEMVKITPGAHAPTLDLISGLISGGVEALTEIAKEHNALEEKVDMLEAQVAKLMETAGE